MTRVLPSASLLYKVQDRSRICGPRRLQPQNRLRCGRLSANPQRRFERRGRSRPAEFRIHLHPSMYTTTRGHRRSGAVLDCRHLCLEHLVHLELNSFPAGIHLYILLTLMMVAADAATSYCTVEFSDGGPGPGLICL